MSAAQSGFLQLSPELSKPMAVRTWQALLEENNFGSRASEKPEQVALTDAFYRRWKRHSPRFLGFTFRTGTLSLEQVREWFLTEGLASSYDEADRLVDALVNRKFPYRKRNGSTWYFEVTKQWKQDGSISYWAREFVIISAF